MVLRCFALWIVDHFMNLRGGVPPHSKCQAIARVAEEKLHEKCIITVMEQKEQAWSIKEKSAQPMKSVPEHIWNSMDIR